MTPATTRPRPTKTRSRWSTSSPPNESARSFEKFCGEILTVNEGGPFVVEPFQRLILADYFAGRRSTLIILPKKNGKTSLLGALGLWHLMTVPDAECVIAAASRDQAGIMMRQIRGFVRRSKHLAGRLDVSKRVVEYPAHGGQIRVLASDVDTVDGAIPTLALIDELHRHKKDDVYGVLRDGLGPRDGRMITISTAGDDPLSPLGEMRKKAYAAGFDRDGCYRHARTDDFVLHEWALDADQDLNDLELVEEANPASWQTHAELKRRHDDPSMRPWQWARFAAGVWTAGEEGAISEIEWNACAEPGIEVPAGSHGVIIGADLAFKWDTTAFVPVWRPDGAETAIVGRPTILEPPRDGTSLAYDEVWQTAVELADRYPGCRFVLDPNRDGEHLAQQIDAELDAEAFTYAQRPAELCLAAQRLSTAITQGTIAHPADPVLTSHVLAAAAYFHGEQWRFTKQRRKKLPIDGIIALAMAYSVLVAGAGFDPDDFHIERL